MPPEDVCASGLSRYQTGPELCGFISLLRYSLVKACWTFHVLWVFIFLVKTGGRISTFGDASITAEGKRYLGAQDRV